MAAAPHRAYPRSSPNPTTRSYDSPSLSSAPSPKQLSAPYLSGGLMNANSRLNAATPQPIGIPPLLPPLGQQSFQPYTPVTATSMVGRESLPSAESLVGTPIPSHPHLPSGTPTSQKRAYRQRRKDPSCDACRERKVKCDATETTSCSECTSRNVKCQFTKETNRRMSSIKQVQDLEKQLDRVRRENSSLRRLLQEQNVHMDLDAEGLDVMPLQLPEAQPESRKRKRSSPVNDMPRARTNIRDFSRGIWKPPAHHRLPTTSALFDPPTPELPTRQVTDQLLDSYYTAVHKIYPVVHWPAFVATVDELYGGHASNNIAPARRALFFAVLAAGSLFFPDSPKNRFYWPAHFLESAKSLMDPWNTSFTLDNARTLHLMAVCLDEMNLKCAAWTWLGIAVRVGQDLELHSESETSSPPEREMRRKIWWSMYILDRSLAIDLGRPVLIDDTDCDLLLPTMDDEVEARRHDPSGVMIPVSRELSAPSMTAVIQVVRVYGSLIKSFSATAIAPTRLATYDQYFVSCLRAFPPPCDPASASRLHAGQFCLVSYLLHARIVLHRHNLSPDCASDVRRVALEQCASAALDTASLLARLDTPLADSATALAATHVFRSALFLLLLGYYDQAVSCIRALASIDSRRDVVIPCGRYLNFFVAALASKRTEMAAYIARSSPPQHYTHTALPPPQRTGPAAIQDMLVRDEELLAYVSADLQASPEASWIWAAASGNSASTESGHAMFSSGAASGLYDAEHRMGISNTEARNWGTWESLEASIRTLASGNAAPTPTSATWAAPLHHSADRRTEYPSTLPPPPPLSTTGASSSSQTNSPTATSRSKNQERISIANII